MTPTHAHQDIATLLDEQEYGLRPGQVAKVSPDRLLYVKKKQLALKAFELVELPLAACSEIAYEVRTAVVPAACGAALVVLGGWGLMHLADLGSARTAMGVAACLLVGVKLAGGFKRHRLTFVVGGDTYTWQSNAGDFAAKADGVARVVALARERGLLAPGS